MVRSEGKKATLFSLLSTLEKEKTLAPFRDESRRHRSRGTTLVPETSGNSAKRTEISDPLAGRSFSSHWPG